MIERILTARGRDLGGFEVRRILPAGGRQMVGPFIFFDHIGPADFAPGTGVAVRPHPHIGLATVTYLFEGELIHRDSLGFLQPIRPGDVNWMTAGRGIVHSERTDPQVRARGARLHGIQSWVALPRESEEIEPAFVHHPHASLPAQERAGVRLRVIAGNAFGLSSPVATCSATLYVDLHFDAGASVEITDEHEERALYVAEGELRIDDAQVPAGSMAVLDREARVQVSAAKPSRVMLLGGAPMEGPRHIWWNFVASSTERIEQAKQDWRSQRFGHVPGETEFIPLPD
jgi:redox-sensitive bicupin YhaK (pirin superfamily)